MIVDFPTDLGASSVFPWLSSEVALADADDDVPEGVCVTTTVTTSPSSFVDAELERIIEGVDVCVGGGVVFAAVLLGGADVVLGGWLDVSDGGAEVAEACADEEVLESDAGADSFVGLDWLADVAEADEPEAEPEESPKMRSRGATWWTGCTSSRS